MRVDRSRLPDIGPEVPVRFPTAERTVLSSGLRLATVVRRDVPVLTFTLIVPTGSAVDPVHQPGLAAITADLLDEGSGDRDAIAIHEALARIGGQLDIDTGYDSTLIGLATLPRFQGEALRLLADMAFRPRLDAGDFQRVRDLRCNRLAQMRDLPAAQAERAFIDHIFGNHPYGHLPIGSEPSLRALTVDDARAFHAARFRPDGALLIAVGDTTHEAVVAAAEAAMAGHGRPGRADFATLPSSPIGGEGRRLVLVNRPGAPQSELRIGHLGVSRQVREYHALVVLNAVLGGQFVSRINLNLREGKGLTYGARSGFDWRRAPGPFVVQTSVQTSGTATAVGEILREMTDVVGDRPPTDRELALARASLTRGYARNFETADQVARGLAQMAIYGLPESWFDDFVDKVGAVDGAAVLAAARAHLRPQDALVTIVGDREQIGDSVAALGFDTTTLIEQG